MSEHPQDSDPKSLEEFESAFLSYELFPEKEAKEIEWEMEAIESPYLGELVFEQESEDEQEFEEDKEEFGAIDERELSNLLDDSTIDLRQSKETLETSMQARIRDTEDENDYSLNELDDRLYDNHDLYDSEGLEKGVSDLESEFDVSDDEYDTEHLKDEEWEDYDMEKNDESELDGNEYADSELYNEDEFDEDEEELDKEELVDVPLDEDDEEYNGDQEFITSKFHENREAEDRLEGFISQLDTDTFKNRLKNFVKYGQICSGDTIMQRDGSNKTFTKEELDSKYRACITKSILATAILTGVVSEGKLNLYFLGEFYIAPPCIFTYEQFKRRRLNKSTYLDQINSSFRNRIDVIDGLRKIARKLRLIDPENYGDIYIRKDVEFYQSNIRRDFHTFNQAKNEGVPIVIGIYRPGNGYNFHYVLLLKDISNNVELILDIQPSKRRSYAERYKDDNVVYLRSRLDTTWFNASINENINAQFPTKYGVFRYKSTNELVGIEKTWLLPNGQGLYTSILKRETEAIRVILTNLGFNKKVWGIKRDGSLYTVISSTKAIHVKLHKQDGILGILGFFNDKNDAEQEADRSSSSDSSDSSSGNVAWILDAIKRNFDYQKLLGWTISQVKLILGISDEIAYRASSIRQTSGTPKADPMKIAFVKSVSRWQSQNYIRKIDGIIGPNTWARMKKILSIDVDRATRRNKHWSKEAGWAKKSQQILGILGLQHSVKVDSKEFAQAVARWQSQNYKNPENIDGILGPNSWSKMKIRL